MKIPDEFQETRLSDRILFAMELAIDQEDVDIADKLVLALEMSMTRNTGGGEFIERRDYPPTIEKALTKLEAIRAKQEAE